MIDKYLLIELEEIVNKIRARIIYLKTENNKLRIRLEELKKCVKEK